MNKRRISLILLFLFSIGAFAWAGETSGSSDLTSQMTLLVFQLAIIIFAVRAGGALAKFMKLPSVIGELLAGVLIGPYALGALTLPGFPLGIFPISPGFAISPTLYAFSTVASIILLFSSGLETDIDMLLHYSLAGGIVGLGGVIASFGFGAGVGALLTHQSFFSPAAMFLGIMSTATSVGITARILSDRKKMDSPEGVTILAAAVFDDVLGIVCLAVVMGIVAAMTGHSAGGLSTWGITAIALKAFGIWLGFTALGLIFGKQISNFLKKLGGEATFSVLALGIALLLAGFFEMQGLAMIIGAYIIGISLSKTDIAFLIQDKTKPLYDFFVPIFFAIMGMLVDVRQIINPAVLGFGLAYTLAAVLAKVIGCGLPSLFLGFNPRGSLRIGIGMVPRGEVALIIAGIGLSGGILDPSIFGVAILMIMVTSIVAPPLFSATISSGGEGTRTPVKGSKTETIHIEFPSHEISELVSSTFLRELQREGFFVQLMSIRDEISHIRKGDVSISLVADKNALTFETAPEDMAFVKTALHETLVALDANFDKLKESYDPEKFRTELHTESGRKDASFRRVLDVHCVTSSLKGSTKEEVITELVEMLAKAGYAKDKTMILADVLGRERQMSTGMEHGIALPHARTLGIATPTLAIGIHKEGIDFGTIDGTPGRIIALIVSPANDEAPHMQMLASLGATLGDDDIRRRLLDAATDAEVYKILTTN
jgi:Kef-type K+ transport system membrane component KefB/mannitol/fructose-specific phosphotransferase system IIA component (Ntr-type)